jgi:hypothetical protein
LVLTNSRDGDSVGQEQVDVPPLFVGLLRDDLIARIEAAFSAGDQEKAAVLLRDAGSAFPGDCAFPALHMRYLQVAQRTTHFEAALEESLNDLGEDRFVASLGKFREALSLSLGHKALERKAYDAGIAAAYQQLASHWRFAETLLQELTLVLKEPAVPGAILTSIEHQKRDESVRIALDESGRAEHAEYLPHMRNRLASLAQAYPEEDGLESRLRALDGLLAQRLADERDKNLRRLKLFRERLDASDNLQTLRRFRELVSPFVDPYPGDAAFLSVLEDAHSLHLTYEKAVELMGENRSQEALDVCDRVLQKYPANILFCAVEEKAKVREWNIRLAHSTEQRARAFKQKAEYAEALEEWEALREIDPRFPGLDSEILHCAALAQHTKSVRNNEQPVVDEKGLTPEIVDREAEYEPLPSFVTKPSAGGRSFRVRIMITGEAWINFKTGLAATAALLLVALIFATSRRP